MMLILPMNTIYASTYVYLHQFLSSVSYNFLSIGVLFPWLNLFLVIFIVPVVNEIVLFVSLSHSSLLVYKNATSF